VKPILTIMTAILLCQMARGGVRIVDPGRGSYVSGPYEIRLAVDEPGSVARTEIHVNGTKIMDAAGWVDSHTHDFGEEILRHELFAVVVTEDGERLLSETIQTRELRINVEATARVILLTAVVKNRRGQPITGLEQDQFRVFENGNELPITSFTNDYLPLDLVLLVDTSSSLRKDNAIVEVKLAAVSFLRELEQGDRVRLYAFGSEPDLLYDFTTDRKRLVDAINGLDAIGETALFDSLHRGLDDLEGRRRGRKAIVLFTDGRDSIYEEPRTKARLLREGIVRAQNQEVAVFIIGLGRYINEAAMERIAEETGGRYHHAANIRRLPRTFEEIVLDLKHQYLIGVQPQSQRTGFNRLEIRARKRGATVYSRTGYTQQ